MKLAFIGTGYVGLVTGVMMAHLKHQVYCIDVDETKINQLKNHISPIYEPGLDDYITKYAASDQLNFQTGYNNKIDNLDAIFITVGTPSLPNGDADLSYVFEALDNIPKIANEKTVIVIKSTVPPGTAQKVIGYLHNKNLNYAVANNPEFLREGNAIYDFLNPDRIIIGTNNTKAKAILEQVYKPLTDKGVELVATDLNTSELIKYASNTFLANKIAFINEMADLCEIIDGNINDLSKAVGLDKRIGNEFLKAGPGFGGSCFPKDILALQHLAKKYNTGGKIVQAIIDSNKQRPHKMLAKITRVVGELSNKNIAVLGLTYKAGTDDLRSSPAIDIINLLQAAGAKVTAFDPLGNRHAHKYFAELNLANDAVAACQDAEAVVLLTEWNEFKELELDKLKHVMAKPVIIDLRNFLDASKLKEAGFKYYTVGNKDGI